MSLDSFPAMLIRILSITAVLLVLPDVAKSQTWTTPDGVLSITPPDAKEFQSVDSPPSPFVALWVSKDETIKLGVTKTQIPPNIKLVQSSVEEGLAEEIGGEVTRLPTRHVSGHEVWNMTAKGSSLEITQAMVQHGDTIYKLMAVTVGDQPDAAAVNRFMNSLSITQPTTEQPTVPAQSATDAGGGVDSHNLSKAIGGAAALIGIGFVVYFLTRGKKSRKV